MAKSSSIPGLAPASCSSVFVAGLVWLLLTHWSFLRLPYHWDELGYFVPAAHDLLTTGALVPHSTPPNVHPPLVMAYLAAAWKLFGFSPPVTRVAMLLIGAATLAATFLLARRLSDHRTALLATTLVAVSPPFVAQSMLAHLDLPATLGALLTIYFFLDQRWALCALAATALVLTKETGIVVPLVLAAFTNRRRFLLPPLLALAAWLLFLRASTGHWLGNAEFERYNVDQAVQIARVPFVLLRRLYQLAFANFHWIATLALFRSRRHPQGPLFAALIGAYLVLHSVLGGAILLRYLLPAMALFYIAAAIVLHRAAAVALVAGLAVCNWWNPPYPFGYEDNLAVVDFVRLQQQGALWLAAHYQDRIITTAWPLTDALSNPLGGYVDRALRVHPVENFQPESWQLVSGDGLDIVVLYSRAWEPQRGWQRWPPLAFLMNRFGYAPQVSREELLRRFSLRSLRRWDRRGQWLEVFERRP